MSTPDCTEKTDFTAKEPMTARPRATTPLWAIAVCAAIGAGSLATSAYFDYANHDRSGSVGQAVCEAGVRQAEEVALASAKERADRAEEEAPSASVRALWTRAIESISENADNDVDRCRKVYG